MLRKANNTTQQTKKHLYKAMLNRYAFILCFSLLVASPVLAGSNWESVFEKPQYFGFGLGASEITLVKGVQSNATESINISADTKDFAYRFFYGLQFHESYDLELRYHSLGEFERNIKYLDLSRQVQVNLDSSLEYESFTFAVKPKYEWSEGFTLFADLAVSYSAMDVTSRVKVSGKANPLDLSALQTRLQSSLGSESESDVTLSYGASAAWRPGQGESPWQWQLFLQYFSVDDQDLSTSGVSVSRFFR